MKHIIFLLTLAVATLSAQVPQTLNYQGRVVVGTTNFTGTGLFKFALVNGDGSVTFWSNDGTSAAGAQPADAVSLPVAAGLYSLRLGDVALANMTAVPPTVFANGDVRLRVWFNDGVNGFEQLAPDSRFAAVPYAMHAGTAAQIADGAVSAASLAPGAVTTAKIASGAVTVDQLNFTGAPNAGQVLGFDGANLTWLAPGGGGGGGSLTLPYSGLAASTGALFSINNSGTTGDPWAIYGHSQTNLGVFGQTHGDAQAGVLGRNDGANGVNGAGVFGYASTQAHGVLAISEQGNGVWAATNGDGQSAVHAQTNRNSSVAGRFHHTQVGTALTAEAANNGWGVFARSNYGLGVFGQTLIGGTGVLGRNESNDGHAVHGYANAGAIGVRGDSVGGDGVLGNTTAANRSGVVGFANNASSNGVAAINGAGTGVFAKTDAPLATAGFFWNSGGGDAIRTSGHLNVTGNINLTGTMTSTGSVTINATTTTRVLTITGGADVAEPFQIGDGEIPKGSVVVIDEERPGELRRSAREYDTRVAGIVSGANGINPGIALHQEGVIEGGQNVALSGRVYVLADAAGGAIKPGDLLTTSATPGHAMRVSDHSRSQGAVLGKAMTPLREGTGYVLVLVTLQ